MSMQVGSRKPKRSPLLRPPKDTSFVYSFEGHELRGQLDVNGDPWFCAKDVCDAIGIQNASDTVRKALDDDERGVATIYTPSGHQEMIVVSEPGMYALIMRSRKPDAKRFDRWVRHEVLVSIRKTGGYSRHPNPAVHLLLADAPCEWDPMFEHALVEGFCKLHNKPIPRPDESQPLWLASSYWKLYRIILGEDVYRQLKKDNATPQFGSNHHQFLQPGPRERFRRELKTVIGFQRAALATPNPKRHFWELMEFFYKRNQSIQMWMPV